LELKISSCPGRIKFWKVDSFAKKIYKEREYTGNN